MNKKEIICISGILGLVLAGFLIKLTVYAATPGIPISVPSATSTGYFLTSTSIGRYIGTTTDPAHFGSIFATSTASSTFMGALQVASTTGTSTFAYGIQLLGGCFQAVNGTCFTGGIASLNGLTGTTQTFTDPDDTNVTLSITSSGTNHTFTMGWTGQLSVARGGTGLTTFGGTNRILYTSTADNLTSSANLLYTGTNFGISTSTPSTILSIQGAANFGSNAISTIYGTTTTQNLVATSTFILPYGTDLIASTTGMMYVDQSNGMLMVATSSSNSSIRTDGNAATIPIAPVPLFTFQLNATTRPFNGSFAPGGTFTMPSKWYVFRIESVLCNLAVGTNVVFNFTHANGLNDTNSFTCTPTSTTTPLTINTNNTWSKGEGISMEFVSESGTASSSIVNITVMGSYLKK